MKKYVKSAKQGAPNINSYVYNALSDVAFELTQAGFDVSAEEFEKACKNFMRKFFADNINAGCKTSVEAAEDFEDDYSEMMSGLEEDLDSGIVDPLYEMTEAGEYLLNLCQEVDESLGVWLEPSVQAGQGRIWIYSTEDDSTIAENIDFASYDDDVIGIAVDSNSEEEFKEGYKAYLNNIIETH